MAALASLTRQGSLENVKEDEPLSLADERPAPEPLSPPVSPRPVVKEEKEGSDSDDQCYRWFHKRSTSRGFFFNFCSYSSIF